jgi:uncharacterized membrane protein (UPF0127 family)
MTAYAYVQNSTRAVKSPARVRVCNSFTSRLRGLMFRGSLGRGEGVLLAGARDARADSAIHMLFVPFDLAVFWINDRREVVDKVLAKAWHLAYIPAHPARYVLELHPDQYAAYDVGHQVDIIDA